MADFFNMLSGTQDNAQQNESRNALADPNQANFQAPGAAGLQGMATNMAGTQLNQSGLNQAVGGQQAAQHLAMNAAQGIGPSVATAQMNQGITQAQQNANSMAAANRGSGGLGMRNAMLAGAGAAGQAAGAGAIARAQEQLGNIATAGNLANAGAQTQLGAQQNMLGQQAANNSALNTGLAAAGMQQQGNMAYEQLKAQNDAAKANLIQTQNQNQAGGFSNALTNVGKIAGIGGSIAGAAFGV